MTVLLDGSVLVPLVQAGHAHHEAVRNWWAGREGRFATCPITQGTLLRLALLAGATTGEALGLLHQVVSQPRHEFWPDDLGYDDVRLSGVVGHRQVTDAYLAQLARRHAGRLATADQGLAALHRDVAVLVPLE